MTPRTTFLLRCSLLSPGCLSMSSSVKCTVPHWGRSIRTKQVSLRPNKNVWAELRGGADGAARRAIPSYGIHHGLVIWNNFWWFSLIFIFLTGTFFKLHYSQQEATLCLTAAVAKSRDKVVQLRISHQIMTICLFNDQSQAQSWQASAVVQSPVRPVFCHCGQNQV